MQSAHVFDTDVEGLVAWADEQGMLQWQSAVGNIVMVEVAVCSTNTQK